MEPIPTLILASVLLVVAVALSFAQSVRHHYPEEGENDGDR